MPLAVPLCMLSPGGSWLSSESGDSLEEGDLTCAKAVCVVQVEPWHSTNSEKHSLDSKEGRNAGKSQCSSEMLLQIFSVAPGQRKAACFEGKIPQQLVWLRCSPCNFKMISWVLT